MDFVKDDLKARIKAKTAAIASRVFMHGYKITLDTGRVITMNSIDQQVTYSGVLEGWPSKRRNDRFVDELIRRYSHHFEKPYVLYAPRDIIHIETDEVKHFSRTSCPQPELLPYITCVAQFYSEEPARDKIESDMSYINMIWFQAEWAMPISPVVYDLLKTFDWDNLAHDGGT